MPAFLSPHSLNISWGVGGGRMTIFGIAIPNLSAECSTSVPAFLNPEMSCRTKGKTWLTRRWGRLKVQFGFQNLQNLQWGFWVFNLTRAPGWVEAFAKSDKTVQLQQSWMRALGWSQLLDGSITVSTVYRSTKNELHISKASSLQTMKVMYYIIDSNESQC